MGAQGNNAAPVIIKKKKVSGGDGHHGGAWKVAYADFVTAMMAFFLLMWLLNATTEKQRKGIADFFSPTVPINRISGGGDGNFGGDSVFSELVLPQNGIGASNRHTTESDQARGEIGLAETGQPGAARDQAQAAETAQFAELEDLLMGRAGESMVSRETRRHILTRVTDEGLVIEVFDLEDARLFDDESDEPTQLLREIAGLVAAVSQLVENKAAVEGHTSARPVVARLNPVWDISASRADRMRVLLEEAGLPPARMRRVTGHADREPAVEDRMAIRNNRLEVILLRSER